MDDGAITKNRQQIVELAAKHALPVVSIYKDFAASGGLIAYGPNLGSSIAAQRITLTRSSREHLRTCFQLNSR